MQSGIQPWPMKRDRSLLGQEKRRGQQDEYK
jgi:hypothetical protein